LETGLRRVADVADEIDNPAFKLHPTSMLAETRSVSVVSILQCNIANNLHSARPPAPFRRPAAQQINTLKALHKFNSI
jgi:hypothetical protein